MTGQTLAEHPGQWFNDPTSFSYQWELCDAFGFTCSAITGATGPTYVITKADIGHAIQVEETASNSAAASSPAESFRRPS